MLVALLVVLAAFPWGLFRGVVERRLAAQLGAPVTIGAMERVDPLSLAPRIRLRAVTIGQPAWAGRGNLATIRSAELRLRVLPLLLGRARIDAVTLDGAVLDLVRDATGRENWRLGGKGGGDGGGPTTVLVRDGRLRMTDRPRHMQFDADLTADAAGLVVRGAGTHRGKPMRIYARTGAALPGQPLQVEIRSPLLRFAARVRLERPFSLKRMTGEARASAPDARILDDVIEAGLPGTQPVTLTTRFRREDRTWHIDRLDGTVGGSRVATTLAVTRPDGRVRIDGTVRAARLDFDDFSSDADRAAGRAREARLGPRVIPFARIDLSKLGNLDLRLRLASPAFVVRGAPMFRTLSADILLDRRRLELAPLRLGLSHGRVVGRIVVDHRSGLPRLDTDLRLSGGRLQELFGSDLMRAPVDARLRLQGRGENFRAAVAHGNGFVALVARNGDVRRRMAALAGGDVLDDTDREVRTALRCLVLRMNATPGRVSTGTFVIDTGASRIDARGAVALPAETMSIVLTGRSKQPDFIRAVPAVRLTGTLSNPRLVFPALEQKHGFFAKAGAVLKVLKIGKQREVAPDANCAALAARALG